MTNYEAAPHVYVTASKKTILHFNRLSPEQQRAHGYTPVPYIPPVAPELTLEQRRAARISELEAEARIENEPAVLWKAIDALTAKEPPAKEVADAIDLRRRLEAAKAAVNDSVDPEKVTLDVAEARP